MLTFYTSLTLKRCSSCPRHGLNSVENSIWAELYFQRNTYKMLTLTRVGHVPKCLSHPENLWSDVNQVEARHKFRKLILLSL